MNFQKVVIILEIRNLVTFLKVTELLSFSKAAEALDYSQSAVTVQIQQLEQELGVKLFDRIGKKVSITQYGLDFIPHARDTISAASRAAHFAARDCDLTGSIRIGFEDTLLRATLPDIIPAYHRRFPHVTVRTSIGSNHQLKQELAQNQLDVLYTLDTQVCDDQFHKVFEQKEDICIIANREHPLTQKPCVQLSDLVDQPFILMTRCNPYRDLFDNALAQQRLSIQPFLELESDVIALRLVAQNPNYMTILPRFSLLRSQSAARMVALDVQDCRLHQWRQLLHHKNKVITPQIQGMLDIITQMPDIRLEPFV